MRCCSWERLWAATVVDVEKLLTTPLFDEIRWVDPRTGGPLAPVLAAFLESSKAFIVIATKVAATTEIVRLIISVAETQTIACSISVGLIAKA